MFGLAIPVAILTAFPAPARAQDAGAPERFRHEIHAEFPCAECHSTGAETVVSNRTWCADCHHVNVELTQCQRCHATTEIAPEPLRRPVTFLLPGGVERERRLLFDHETHASRSCASCHTRGGGIDSAGECSSCHSDHHRAGSRCLACHREPTPGAHTAEVHLDIAGCGASGCHVAEGVDYASLPDDRNFCLSCHVEQQDHERPNPCAECHLLSAYGETPP